MTYRKKFNRHDIWSKFLQNNFEEIKLTGLPEFIYKTEQSFRDFLTKGFSKSPDNKTVVNIEQLSSENLEILWVLVNHKFPFDMDTLLFDSFNEEYAKRHSRA